MVDGRITPSTSRATFRLAHGQPCVVVDYRDDNVLRRNEFPLAGIGNDSAFAALLREGQVETTHTREVSLDAVFVADTGGQP
jgi:fluoroquinolone transport system ATP-binding protein